MKHATTPVKRKRHIIYDDHNASPKQLDDKPAALGIFQNFLNKMLSLAVLTTSGEDFLCGPKELKEKI